MRTLIEVLNLSTDFLKLKGISNPRRQAEELISNALNVKRMQIYLDHDRPLTHEEIELLRTRLARRAKGEPNPYIHGFMEFLGCQLQINPSVLIPRPETEILAEKITEELKELQVMGKELWDICSGSGCLGIALKKHFPELQVCLSDISPAALALAKDNAFRNSTEVEFIQGDLLSPFKGRKAHFVVCNPPYVSEEEFKELDKEVKNFEPSNALLGGATGLLFYERLSKALPDFLFPGARVWLEIGSRQGAAVLSLFSEKHWKKAHVKQDWSGKDRFFFLEIE